MLMSKIALAVVMVMALCAGASAGTNQMTPWFNSNIYGTLAKYNPALKDDFYGAVNLEWLKNTKLKPGYVRTGSFTELQDTIDARLKSLMTDVTIPGHDSDPTEDSPILGLRRTKSQP